MDKQFSVFGLSLINMAYFNSYDEMYFFLTVMYYFMCAPKGLVYLICSDS